MTAPNRRPPRKPIKGSVIEYLLKRVGQTLYLGDIASDLSVPEDLLIAVMARAAHDGLVEVVIRARSWRVKGLPPIPAQIGGKIFQQIGVTRSGEAVLQCEDNIIYIAREVGTPL